MWDAENHRGNARNRGPFGEGYCDGWQRSRCPRGKTFIIAKEDQIGKGHVFSGEKLSPVLAIFRYSGFDNALSMIQRIFEVGGKGHFMRNLLV